MIARLVRALLGATIEGCQRFCVTATAVVITAIIFSLDIAGLLVLKALGKEWIYPLLSVFSLASLAMQIGFESRGFGRVAQHVAAISGGAVATALVWFASDVGLSELTFVFGLYGAVLVSAHWFRGTSAGFWFFIVRLLFAAGLALFAVVVFVLGVAAIIASVEYLFGFDVPDNIYRHMWAIAFFVAGPLFVLGRIPKDFDAVPVIRGDNFAISGLRLVSDYLAAPMLGIYALILHVYALKILISGEVPQNQIGWMVICYCTMVIFFWKVMLPLREVLTVSGRMFLRIWPVMVVVPTLLQLYAVSLRIGEYGVTPDRYFLVAFGVLMLVYAVMQVIPRLQNWLPGAGSLCATALLLGSFGPWGAEMVSVNSQVQEFASLLDDKSQIVSGEEKRAANILSFLNKYDALQNLKAVGKNLDGKPFTSVEGDSKAERLIQLSEAFGAKEGDVNNDTSRFNFTRGLVSVAEYDLHVANLSLYPGTGSFEPRELRSGLKIKVTKNAIVIIDNDAESLFPLTPLLELAKTSDGDSKARGFLLKAGDKSILLVPRYYNLKNGSNVEMYSGTAELFLRSADWE